METKKPNYTETKAKSPGIPGNFPLGENKEGEYKGEMENVVKPSTLNQRCCSKSNEQIMKCKRIKNSNCENCFYLLICHPEESEDYHREHDLRGLL